MSSQVIFPKNAKRKNIILEAALKCFLQFGYAKTSMNDIAREAGISRPLIYLKFKSKEDLYVGVFKYLTEGRVQAAQKILKYKLSKKDKLIYIFEVFLLEPWEQTIGKPMSADFYANCRTLVPKLTEKYKYQRLKCIQSILIDEKTSETFMLAAEGLKSDLPDTKVLRNRLLILIDHFLP
jgi:AcrR family transcriptional regulator